MLGNPLKAIADNREFCLDIDRRKLGRVSLVATWQSPALAARRLLVFTSFDGSAFVELIIRSACPLAAIRSLLGTSSGPIISTLCFPYRYQGLLFFAQLDRHAASTTA